MREIKFRAWDRDYAKMSEIDFCLTKTGRMFWINNDGALCGGFENPTYDPHYPSSGRFVLMQFTGLKDGKGREIYEGDILQHKYPAGYTNYTVKYGKFDNGMEYEEQELGVGWYIEALFKRYYAEKWKEDEKNYTPGEKIKNIYGSYPSYEGCEVIGNVYENPELVK